MDLKSTETASVTLSDEILRNSPNSSLFPSSWEMVNRAPGVVDFVAYGSSKDDGINWTMDGIDIGDTDIGGAWVYVDPNSLEEAKFMGVGLPAEYGNFTGAIFNMVTKTGGNTLSGYAEIDFQGVKEAGTKSFWQAENNGAYLAIFPG